LGPSQGSESGLTREVAEQGCAIFGVPSGLFSPEFDASFVLGGAPEVDGDEAVPLSRSTAMARLSGSAVANRGSSRRRRAAARAIDSPHARYALIFDHREMIAERPQARLADEIRSTRFMMAAQESRPPNGITLSNVKCH
jgi:hypothetical protein